jgi:hypothetical protein
MAGRDVAGTLLLKPWRNLATEIGSQETPPGKGATLDALLEARHLSGDFDEAPCCTSEGGSEPGYRAEQALRIGMTGGAEKLGYRRLLNLSAGIHHHDALGDFSNHPEIMRDQDDRRTDASLEVQHQLQDLRLDRDIQRRCRLVGDQELGVACQ